MNRMNRSIFWFAAISFTILFKSIVCDGPNRSDGMGGSGDGGPSKKDRTILQPTRQEIERFQLIQEQIRHHQLQDQNESEMKSKSSSTTSPIRLTKEIERKKFVFPLKIKSIQKHSSLPHQIVPIIDEFPLLTNDEFLHLIPQSSSSSSQVMIPILTWPTETIAKNFPPHSHHQLPMEIMKGPESFRFRIPETIPKKFITMNHHEVLNEPLIQKSNPHPSSRLHTAPNLFTALSQDEARVINNFLFENNKNNRIPQSTNDQRQKMQPPLGLSSSSFSIGSQSINHPPSTAIVKSSSNKINRDGIKIDGNYRTMNQTIKNFQIKSIKNKQGKIIF